jgi:helix-turn-helix protein
LNDNQHYSAAEVERMMKLQDILLKAMAGKMRWWEAAEIIGVTARTMRRWRERLEEHGYDGLTDRRKGKCSQRRVPVKTCEEVLRLGIQESLVGPAEAHLDRRAFRFTPARDIDPFGNKEAIEAVSRKVRVIAACELDETAMPVRVATPEVKAGLAADRHQIFASSRRSS